VSIDPGKSEEGSPMQQIHSHKFCILSNIILTHHTGKRSEGAAAALDKILKELETEGLRNGGQLYLSGLSEPHLGDLAVFGTLRSIWGLPLYQAIVEEPNGPIREWYNLMAKKVDHKASYP
jgi:hypothetical protein